MRHRNDEIWLDKFDGSDLNKKDATFRAVPGLADPASFSLESFNYPGHYIRHCNDVLFISKNDNSPLFCSDATFCERNLGSVPPVQEAANNNNNTEVRSSTQNSTTQKSFGSLQQYTSEDILILEGKHVMISYSWNQKEPMRKLASNLREFKIPVWIDIHEMQGNLWEKMAEAIDHAFIVIVGLSDDYRDSENCQKEYAYAVKNNKPLIYVKVGQFTNNGWLSLHVGNQLYYEVNDKELVDKIIKRMASITHESK